MLIKAGVDISRLERNTRRGLQFVANVFKGYDQEIIITSTFEGNHGEGSLHYANQAFDVRWPVKSKDEIMRDIRDRLPASFDVSTEMTHIHIEYDPK